MAWNEWTVLALTFISAAVALWTVHRWWKERPVHDVRARVLAVNEFPMVSSAHRGEAEYIAQVKNFSSGPVRDVVLTVVGGTAGTGTWRKELTSLEPRETVEFTVDTEDLDAGWFLIAFTPTVGGTRSMHMTWHPFREDGPLEEVRTRQLVEARIRRAIAHRVLQLPPTPGTYAASTMKASPQRLARLQLQGPPRHSLPMPQRLLLKLLPMPTVQAAGLHEKP